MYLTLHNIISVNFHLNTCNKPLLFVVFFTSGGSHPLRTPHLPTPHWRLSCILYDCPFSFSKHWKVGSGLGTRLPFFTSADVLIVVYDCDGLWAGGTMADGLGWLEGRWQMDWAGWREDGRWFWTLGWLEGRWFFFEGRLLSLTSLAALSNFWRRHDSV